jgi:putative transposase
MIAFNDDNHAVNGVEQIYKLLQISSSTYHAHVAKCDDPSKLSNRERRDAALSIEVRRMFDANFRAHGVRKIWRQYRREGFLFRSLHRCPADARHRPGRRDQGQAGEHHDQ